MGLQQRQDVEVLFAHVDVHVTQRKERVVELESKVGESVEVVYDQRGVFDRERRFVTTLELPLDSVVLTV